MEPCTVSFLAILETDVAFGIAALHAEVYMEIAPLLRGLGGGTFL